MIKTPHPQRWVWLNQLRDLFSKEHGSEGKSGNKKGIVKMRFPFLLRFKLRRDIRFLQHKMKPVLKVYFSHTSVDIQVEQIDVRVEFFEPFFDSLRNDVIGDAAERLHANNLVDSLSGEMSHLGR